MTTAETFTAGKIEGVNRTAKIAAAAISKTRFNVGCDSSHLPIPATTAPPHKIQVKTCRSECPSNPADPAATHPAESASTTASTTDIGVAIAAPSSPAAKTRALDDKAGRVTGSAPDAISSATIENQKAIC
jgi:hypothetical protein